MADRPRVLDGISEWIKKQVGPDAANRGDDDTADDDTDDESAGDRDAPACCSAAGNSDVTVIDT
jgi:hypothetical protein